MRGTRLPAGRSLHKTMLRNCRNSDQPYPAMGGIKSPYGVRYQGNGGVQVIPGRPAGTSDRKEKILKKIPDNTVLKTRS
jgi:hypothetical protein